MNELIFAPWFLSFVVCVFVGLLVHVLFTKKQEITWIKSSEQPPQEGYIVKRWGNGAIWAGVYTGDPKMANCDYWLPLNKFKE